MEITGVHKFINKDKVYSEVVCDSTSYKITCREDSLNALDGDVVKCLCLSDGSCNKIVQIVERCKTPILGVLHTSSPTVYGLNKLKRGQTPKKKFTPYNKSFPQFVVGTKITLQSSDTYVLITPTGWEGNNPTGNIYHTVGTVGDYEAEKACIKIKNSVNWKKYNKTDDYLTPDVYSQSRDDFTQLTTVSVDPDNCTDIDDALHFKKISENLIEIGVHIADVSSFVKENSLLDVEIRKRSQSVYLEFEQINMLPDTLATNLCSLLQGVERRVVSVIYTLNTLKLNSVDCVVKTEFKRGIIVNKNSLSYDEAELILLDKMSNKLSKDVCDTVKNLYSTGRELYKTKLKNVEDYDTHNFLDLLKEDLEDYDTHNFLDLLKEDLEDYDTHKMIEIFMVMANASVATYLKNKIGDGALIRTCKGYATDSNINKDVNNNYDDYDDYKKMLEQVNIFKMSKAEYSLSKIGQIQSHTPLNEACYTHFTSPIRRYADVTVHRQLCDLIFNKTDNIIKIDQHMCDVLNKTSSSIKMAQKESQVLKLLYNIYNSNSSVIDSIGYVVSIEFNKLYLYVPSFKMCLDVKLFSKKALLVTDFTYYQDDNKITVGDKTYNLLDKLNIRVVITVKTPYVKKKILVQILDD